ncbi:PDZ domain-containing protein 8 isoform X1 [Dendropsophus ebraccatus]|uniref:PDZ domain-containing protein 8 isoform X1 n=1 Tax=Dendropsophus ebraccatus TaxID=150705 RepID=UPI00383139AE
MVYALLLAALAGCVATLVLQLVLLYRRPPAPPPPPPPSTPGRTVQADASLRDYLLGAAGGPESCHFLNAIFLFLFRELRDTAVVRRWLLRKIRVELEELLLSRTAGRLLEGLSLRELDLGEAVPVLRGIRLVPPGEPREDEPLPPELSFELEAEYEGGLRMAVDVELLFGKSASLSVRLGRVQGRLRLMFCRLPFTHWAFCFLDEPLIDFQVHSQFEGRPMPQLTSIIVTQLKRVIKRKHTVPNYKIRYKPFFPMQVVPPAEDVEDRPLSLQDLGLTEGRLKVSVIDCSRLLIFGSYDQETFIHCTLEISSAPWKEKTRTSIKTVELIKGTSQNIGLVMVQARDGDTGHVCVETVTPNSPAAGADLRKGDRLIAIGGIKVTSSVQASKLIKQAGDRVLLFYERPAGQSQGAGGPPENVGSLDDPAFTQTFDEDSASLIVDPENRELDSEFEDLACEVKPPVESKDDIFLPVNQSPKRIVGNLSTKSLGSISPILSRKPNPSGPQVASKVQAKAGKTNAPENQDPPQLSRTSSGSGNKPPVPPRPQVKLTLTTCETLNTVDLGEAPVEKLDKTAPPSMNGEKISEKPPKAADLVEELMSQKPNTVKPDPTKDKISEGSVSTKEVSEDQHVWESADTHYRGRQGRWTRASCIFDIESHHKYLNVALWCRDSFKTGSLCCVGHVSIKLEDISLECLSMSSLEYLSSYRLNAPEPKASVSRTALRSLSMHKGFNEKFCYGDITLSFKYLMEGESESSSILQEKEKEGSVTEELGMLQKEETPVAPVTFCESKHNFQDTQFQNSTLCDHCKRKVWTKAASQCMICGYVCHKKCQEKCLAENPYCVSLEKRVDLESKSLGNRTTGLTRHIINTSSRLLSLRQAPKARPSEQGVLDLVEPSPKQTPNTSDNESSDTETGGAGSPSKRVGSSSSKLVRKEGGLDDSVFIAVKEIGRDLYRGLPTDERIQKLEFMLDKLQNEIDQELEHNNSLVKEERETTDSRRKILITAALAKSGERLQALTLLMIHYRAGIEDIESLENSSLAHPRKMPRYDEESIAVSETAENEDDEVTLEEKEALNDPSEENPADSPEME